MSAEMCAIVCTAHKHAPCRIDLSPDIQNFSVGTCGLARQCE